jgi:hypothetical protein
MKRLLLMLLLVAALATSVGLLLRPGAQASPDVTITVNRVDDTDYRDAYLTLREALKLATGELSVENLHEGECHQVSTAQWVGWPSYECFLVGPPPGGSSPDTIVFDTYVFPPGSPATIILSSTLPTLDTGGDTIDGTSAGVIVSGVTKTFDCFDITSANNTIKGLQIYNCMGGVAIHGGAHSNTVGGGSPGERNVISGNWAGVHIWESGTDGNVVKGNYIGTNATGTAALAGSVYGVHISAFAGQNSVGGSSPGERNIISGNAGAGVAMFGSGTNGNTVKGNFIGTNAAGTGALPNGWGVQIAQNPSGGPQANTIGGTATGEGNLIAYNTLDGVTVYGTAATGNSIRGNSIHSNGWQGIENTDGGNTELAPPTVTGFGSVTGTACASCTVDIYSDDEDEGEVYEGSTTASTGGNWSFTGSLDGPNVTATTTDSSGNTSEFSPPVAVPEPLDSDCDGFTDDVETYLGTDYLDACPDGPTDDAWPLDVSMDAQISVVGDVLNFRGRIGATPGAPTWWQRLDFNMDGQLSVVGDVLLYRGRIGDTCT